MKSPKLVHVGSGLYAPERIHIDSSEQRTIWNEALLQDLGYSATLVLEGHRYVIDELNLRRPKGGPPITGELIRRLPVQSTIRLSVHGRVGVLDANGKLIPLRLSAPDIERILKEGATDETLSVVAQLYVSATLVEDPPAKTVAMRLAIPQSTAGYWIRRAKDRGFLDG